MLAVAGGKGGSGKTTTALGLAAALAHAGTAPLVVDADIDMPDAHVATGVAATPNTDDIAAGHSVDQVRQSWDDVPGVGIVAAGSRADLRAALRRVDTWPGPVLVDCPAGASLDVARPLHAAERSLLVTTDTEEALVDTVKTAALARELAAPPIGAAVRGSANRAGAYLDRLRHIAVPELEKPTGLGRKPLPDAYSMLAELVCEASGRSRCSAGTHR